MSRPSSNGRLRATGSLPGNRTDIDELVHRKRVADDFDVVLVFDISRFTRSGSVHGFYQEWEFAKAGLRLVMVAEDMPQGRYGRILRAVAYEGASDHARMTGVKVADAHHTAVKNHTMSVSSKTPFGTHRLYVTADGKHSHLIRSMPDGTQEKLDPNTRSVIGIFGSNHDGGGYRHYRKQKDEKVYLVPGDPGAVDIVLHIFRRSLKDGWGSFNIARELNDRGDASPNGKEWAAMTVRHLLRNPCYLGRNIGNRTAFGRYATRGTNEPVQIDDSELASRRHMPRRVRPQSDWVIVDEPYMAEFLPVELRELAQKSQDEFYKKRGTGKSSRSKHVASAWILTGLLKSKLNGKPMSGWSSVYTSKLTGLRVRRRAYQVRGANLRPSKKTEHLRRLVPAVPIERLVLDNLHALLRDKAVVQQRVEKWVKQINEGVADVEGKLGKRRIRLEQIKRKLSAIFDNLTETGKLALKQETTKLEAEFVDINSEIAVLESRRSRTPTNERKVISAVIRRLAHLDDSLSQPELYALRQTLSILVNDLTVDQLTLEVEGELRIPSWALPLDGKSESDKCLSEIPFPPTFIEADRKNGLFLGKIAGQIKLMTRQERGLASAAARKAHRQGLPYRSARADYGTGRVSEPYPLS